MAAPHSAPSIFYTHIPKNLLLILLSIAFLPVTTILTCISLLISRSKYPYFLNKPSQNASKPPSPGRTQKTILVTGVSMTKGLALTRLFHKHTSCIVIGADTEPITKSPGRFSNALTKFHRLTAPVKGDKKPYLDSLVTLIEKEKVDLWVSCSGVASAVEDGEVAELIAKRSGGRCKAVQFGPEMIEKLHEKDGFMEYMRSLGERIPETHKCASVEEIEAVLAKAEVKRKKYILKSVGMDDKTRANMTLLPFSNKRLTEEYVRELPVSTQNPWLVQEYIFGKEYCTHSLVVDGEVKAFVSCPSSELLMHYEALQPSSKLNVEMLEFTKRVARRSGPKFTGHLSFDFLVKDADQEGFNELVERDGVEIYPIECNPRAHTAVALFNDTPELADRYMEIIIGRKKSASTEVVMPKFMPDKYYWVGHDLVTLIILPILALFVGRESIGGVRTKVDEFMRHLFCWKDGTYEIWDPIPFFWLYHVYWPMQFLNSILTGKKWSRINVSTTKVFEC